MASVSNRFELLSTPQTKRKRDDNSTSPTTVQKKHKQVATSTSEGNNRPLITPPCEPQNIFFNQEAANFLDELSTIGEKNEQGMNRIGATLAIFLNKIGEKLEFLSKENATLKNEICALKRFNAQMASQDRKKKGLLFRSQLISDLKSSAKTSTIISTNLDNHARNPARFLQSKSRSIRQGLIKPSIKVFKSNKSPDLSNIDILCNTVQEKKQLDHELREKGLAIRQNWPKKMLTPIKTIRDRYGSLYKDNFIMIRPHEAFNSLNIWRRAEGENWTFVENINLPTNIELANTDGPFIMKSTKIKTDDIFCTQTLN